MRFAIEITTQNLDAVMSWNGGLRPDDEVIDSEFYLITSTEPIANELISKDTFESDFILVDTVRPETWAQVMDINPMASSN